MQEREVVVKSGDISLAGTLSLPKGEIPLALVICMHGSGQLDRNENAGPQKLNIFNALSDRIVASGMACFRYDKRGIGKSSGNYHAAGHSDLVADALAVTRHFLADTSFSQVFLLGHSEGCIIAPQVADAARVDGLVLLAPFITPLGELLEAQGQAMQKAINEGKGISGFLVRQYVRLKGGVSAINARLIERVRQSDQPVIRVGLRKVEARWIREMLALDPVEVIKSIDIPTLVFVAGADVQCPPEDGAEIARIIGEKATHVMVPGLSHILRMQGKKTGFSGYKAQLKRPMEPGVADSVVKWLLAQSKPTDAA